MNSQNQSLLKSLGFFTSLFRVAKWDEVTIGIIMTSFFINLFGLVFPIFLLQVYDRVIPNTAIDTLLLLTCGAVAILLVDFILNMGRSYITANIDASFEHRLGFEAFKLMLNAKAIAYEKLASGLFLEHLSSIASIKTFYGGQALGLLFDLLFIGVYLFIIYYIGGWIILAPLLMIIILAYLTIHFSEQIRKSLKVREVDDQKKVNFIIEVLTRIHIVKSLGVEAPMLRRYDRLHDQATISNYQLGLKNNKITLTNNALNQFTTLLTLTLGTLLVINEKMTVGSLAACVLIANRALQPIGRALYLWVQSQAVQIAKIHVEEVTHLPQENNHQKPVAENIQGKITLEDVSFAYPYTKSVLFKSLNLEIKAGETIGITGENGVGKTTFLCLIAGLYEPALGKISIDDYNLQEVELKSIRRKIAFLPQKGLLFSGTILENITLFRSEFNEKARLTANKLGLLEEVTRLPRGFDTIVGKNAVDMLSLGLRQRICIVRALLEDPPIILFDEANNGVDLKSDTLLKKMLIHYKSQATIILVSRRPSYLAIADKKYRLSREGLNLILGEEK